MSDLLIAWHAAFATYGVVPTLFRWHALLEVPLEIRWARYRVVASQTRSLLLFVPLGPRPLGAPLWHNSDLPPLSRPRDPAIVVTDLLHIVGLT
jgi:hypothetical protein